mmetsp:Transcript_9531/g.22817  ORF Transcript_9531/g.22817 Transcript_9531/m.22817 type:complete len:327 (-) Transcript_9531:95-1075(-)
MSILKLLPLALIAVAGADTSACQADDVALLQEKLKSQDVNGQDAKGQGNLDFPELGALKDALGNIADQVTDFANKGIDQVTNQLGDALEAADNEVLVLQAKCNDSVEVFRVAMKMNATIAENITRVKKLADETVGALMPLYKTISEQVTNAFSAATTLLKPIGLHDEAEKLAACAKSAVDYLTNLKEKAAATLTDLKEASEENLAPTLAKLKENLGSARSTAASFTSEFDSTFQGFADSFVQAVLKKLPEDKKETLGANIQNSADTLTGKVHDLCEDVSKLLDGASSGLEHSALSVDPKLGAAMEAEVSSPGFFGSILNFFKRLFR